MEKRELGILGVVVLGIVVIGFLGNFTGYVVNESAVECNIADFNGDGRVNYVDKEDFGEAFSLILVQGDPKGLLDFNSDGRVDITDANVYNNLYEENYGVGTGDCYLRGEMPEKKAVVQKIAELPSEKPSFWQRIKNFFKK